MKKLVCNYHTWENCFPLSLMSSYSQCFNSNHIFTAIKPTKTNDSGCSWYLTQYSFRRLNWDNDLLTTGSLKYVSGTTSWHGRSHFSHPNLSMFCRKIWTSRHFWQLLLVSSHYFNFLLSPISNSIPCVFFCFSSQTYTRFKSKSTLTKALSFCTSSSFTSQENFTRLHHSTPIFPFQLKPSPWRIRRFIHMEGERTLLILGPSTFL